MAYPVYYVVEDDTLPILWDSFDGGTGASITMSGLATTDIEIYKDGGTTQRASDNGYTLLDTDGTDFDGLTGIHGISIDLSDNSDAGFYTVGPWFHVVISSVTIDSQTVSFIAAAFRILDATRGMAGTALPDAAADAAGGLPISDAGGLDLDTQIGTDIDAILVDTGTTLDGKIDTIDTNVDAILVDTGTTLDGKIDTIDGNVDSILTDTNELQGDWTNAGRLDAILDAIVADTNELQTDDIPTLIGNLNDISAADVNTQVLDVLNTDTFAEPGQGAPAATTTLVAKIGYLYKNWRNKKTQDGTTWELYDDAGTTVDQKATVSDDGTDAEKGEIATGP